MVIVVSFYTFLVMLKMAEYVFRSWRHRVVSVDF